MSTVLRRKPLLCLISCHLVTRQQVLLNHCLVPQRAPSTSRNCQWVTIRCPAQLLISITVRPAHSYCQWGTTEEVIKSRVVWWSSDGEWEKRQIQAFFWRGWRSPNFGSVGELEGPRNRLKTTTCSAPEPSLRPSTSLGPGLEERWTLPHPCLCNLLAVAIFLGLSLWELISPFGRSEETEDLLGRAPGSVRHDSWAECGKWSWKTCWLRSDSS